MNWTNILIEETNIQYNRNDRPIYYSCNWCGNAAYKTVTRTSTFSWNTYTDYICDKCIIDKWTIKKEVV